MESEVVTTFLVRINVESEKYAGNWRPAVDSIIMRDSGQKMENTGNRSPLMGQTAAKQNYRKYTYTHNQRSVERKSMSSKSLTQQK